MFIVKMVWDWLTGSGLQTLAAIYAKGKDSQVALEQVKADVAKKRLDTHLEMQRLSQQIRLATAGFWEMRVLTFLIAAPFVLHLILIGADTCFKLGLKIPPFPHPFDAWEGQILLSFFGIAVAGKAISTAGAALLARR